MVLRVVLFFCKDLWPSFLRFDVERIARCHRPRVRLVTHII